MITLSATFRAHGILFCAAFLCACGGSSSQGSEAPLPPVLPPPTGEQQLRLEELNLVLAPLDGTTADSSLHDLTPLARVAEAQFVGLGEATHGTREFFELKHKILRWLVDVHGVRVFAIEADPAESVYIDRHVQSGAGDPVNIMHQHMHFWTWNTNEVRDLIRWMRAWNADRPPEDRLRYVGVDCQVVNLQPALILEYLSEAMPGLLARAEPVLSRLHGAGASRYRTMSEVEYHEIRIGLEQLELDFDLQPDTIQGQDAQYRRREARYLLVNLGQAHTQAFQVAHADYWTSAGTREKCMADNTLAVETLVGPGTRVAVWGHNYHVATSSSWEPNPTMGSLLRDRVGEAYRVIGFSLGGGTLTAANTRTVTTHTLPAAPRQGSINALFHAAQAPDFILDLSELPADGRLRQWLAAPQAFLFIGATYDPHQNYYFFERLLENFDAVIHVDQTTHTQWPASR